MKKGLSMILTLLLLLGCICVPVYAEPVAPSTPAMVGVAFFANGTPITISDATTAEMGATITWDGGSTEIPEDTIVFGGSHDHDGKLATTSITINGGQVLTVVGGGLHKSAVETATITMTGGSVYALCGGGIAANDGPLEDDCLEYAGDVSASTTSVDTSIINVSGGSVGFLSGSGNRLARVDNVETTVSGGTIGFVSLCVAGYVNEGTTTISGGIVSKLSGIHSGKIERVKLYVTGGTVTDAYMGCPEGLYPEVPSEIATFGSSFMRISGGTVEAVSAGDRNGAAIDMSIPAEAGRLTLEYDYAKVGNALDVYTEFGNRATLINQKEITLTGGNVYSDDCMVEIEGETFLKYDITLGDIDDYKLAAMNISVGFDEARMPLSKYTAKSVYYIDGSGETSYVSWIQNAVGGVYYGAFATAEACSFTNPLVSLYFVMDDTLPDGTSIPINVMFGDIALVTPDNESVDGNLFKTISVSGSITIGSEGSQDGPTEPPVNENDPDYTVNIPLTINASYLDSTKETTSVDFVIAAETTDGLEDDGCIKIENVTTDMKLYCGEKDLPFTLDWTDNVLLFFDDDFDTPIRNVSTNEIIGYRATHTSKLTFKYADAKVAGQYTGLMTFEISYIELAEIASDAE